MKISVVIPVYNAVEHLPEAIQSALAQPEVAEILIVDDGSQDISLQTAVMYAQNNPDRIRVLRHPDHGNHGAAATRNLGMTHAKSPHIAFLDADDIYLKGRFIATEQLFLQHPEADGIYETVETRSTQHDAPETLPSSAGPQFARIAQGTAETLFRRLALAEGGYIHLNGLVLRSNALGDDLMFDPKLRQCQDTDFVFRWAMAKKLYGGNPERVIALRRLHSHNRIFNTREALDFRFLCMRKCAVQAFYGSVDKQANRQILNRMARATRLIRALKKWHVPVTPFRIAIIGLFILTRPHLLSRII